MKINKILVLPLLLITVSCVANTTLFWQKQLNLTDIHFQSYAGIYFGIQDIKRLINILKMQKCTTLFLELWVTMYFLMNLFH